MSEKRARVEERLKEENPKALFADGFDDCILGIAYCAGRDPLVAYDTELCIRLLMDRDGMERDEAEEFFEFNTVSAFVGEGTPLFIDTEV
ncbi:MAG: hypothetical protein AB7O65_11800 [Candidatus Korobacteraceae bacterium]